MKTKRYFRTRIIALFGVGLTVIIIMWKNVSNSKNQFDVFQKRETNLTVVGQTFGIQRFEDIACVRFQGRLGNLMMEYVFLYVVAKMKHLYPVVPENSELFQIFDIEKTTLTAIGKSADSCAKLPVYKERWGLSYDEKLHAVPPYKSVKFDGYFQSWKYWIKYENEIRNLLRFKNPIKQKAFTQMRDIIDKMKFEINKESVIVSIHIRRGDYVTEEHYKYGKLTPNETYYANAMQYFKTRHKNILFVVGSNDIDWSKKALAKEKNVYYSTGNSPAEDIALLSLANHTIMSVGTFGWWIGWMAQGTSIYYKNIFRPQSDFAKEFRNNSIDDFIYPGWIPME
ncbi:galactoside alpha-(1,2)-fucosyltransferase 2-like [Crassostrea angulata]|uniref:galactoside alpha-(1,2)-fucosyltransferase 2-like n=1 Tax=Magallana angulata TaxID=2784310 RepID=UPI0022B0E1AA|nr:galactoside alpha-(1,2)-fucosyltransferase 2-like [Crassostrea angulata]XP_052686290.1 galactoside alpha-(1,2)-fucosyltransferase 2-like [Crassostrea angulata]XP_052686291.1 galactoside alpha-(1,2)-fucosyltransferase 2-like [Crassostrea angulata]XP_052686292.1 galactoside alpha-(1,2)-fucosyltransferase 2-like [Crassostrea angulata]